MTNEDIHISRRKVIAGTGAATAGALAGCGGSGSSSESNELELLHAWSSGDGKRAIEALINGFKKKHPDVKFAEEPVNGAARKNLDQVVLNKLKSNDPPSTFQTWPGEALKKFGKAYKSIEGDVWNSELKKNYLPGPKKQAKFNGNFVTVPLNIHRINNLFYNTSVVEEAGVDPSSLSSPGDLVDACSTIASETDATPFAQQTKSSWSTVQLWETIFLAEAGIDGYNKFLKGNGSKSDVKSALQNVKALREYYPKNSSSIGFTEANKQVMEGKAAFIHQGDWAAGAYSGNSDFKYKQDWNQVTYPGTSGSYLLNMDSFPYMKNNPSPKATKKFLSYCGSTEGQIKFNKRKGSIPPRKDADVSSLNKFQQDQFDDFKSAGNQPPSIQHGLGVRPAVRTNITDAFSTFLESYNASKTAQALVDAFN